MTQISNTTYRSLTQVLLDRLEDHHLSEQIPTKLYEKKKSIRSVVNAINAADQMISSLRKRKQRVALLIPKDIHVLPLQHHDNFYSDHADKITEDPLADSHPEIIDTYLHQKPWLRLQGIFTSMIPVYKDHPGQTKKSGYVQRLNFEQHNESPLLSKEGQGVVVSDGASVPLVTENSSVINTLYYDTETRTIRLQSAFSENIYLVFEGILMPEEINLRAIEETSVDQLEKKSDPTASPIVEKNCSLDWKTMHVQTPIQFRRLLLDVAMSELLPSVVDGIAPQEIETRLAGGESANGPTTYTPTGQYAAFGIS